MSGKIYHIVPNDERTALVIHEDSTKALPALKDLVAPQNQLGVCQACPIVCTMVDVAGDTYAITTMALSLLIPQLANLAQTAPEELPAELVATLKGNPILN